jgi:hypothetical protein
MTMAIAGHDLRLNELQAPENTGHTNPSPESYAYALVSFYSYKLAS